LDDAGLKQILQSVQNNVRAPKDLIGSSLTGSAGLFEGTLVNKFDNYMGSKIDEILLSEAPLSVDFIRGMFDEYITTFKKLYDPSNKLVTLPQRAGNDLLSKGLDAFTGVLNQVDPRRIGDTISNLTGGILDPNKFVKNAMDAVKGVTGAVSTAGQSILDPALFQQTIGNLTNGDTGPFALARILRQMSTGLMDPMKLLGPVLGNATSMMSGGFIKGMIQTVVGVASKLVSVGPQLSVDLIRTALDFGISSFRMLFDPALTLVPQLAKGFGDAVGSFANNIPGK